MFNNTYDFLNVDLSVNNNERPSSYGQWSDKRRMAFVETMIEHHPFSVKRGGVTAAWKRVIDDVNNTDKSLNKLARSTLEDNLKTFIRDIKDKMTKDLLETGTNDSETTFEDRMLTLITMMEEHDDSVAKKSDKDQRELVEKRDRNARLIEASKRGNGKGKGASINLNQFEDLDDDDYQIISDDDEILARQSKKARLNRQDDETEIDYARRELRLVIDAVNNDSRAQTNRAVIVEKSISTIERLVAHQQVIIKQMQQQMQQQQRLQSNQFGLLSHQISQAINTFNQYMLHQENRAPVPPPLTPIPPSPKKARQTNNKKK